MRNVFFAGKKILITLIVVHASACSVHTRTDLIRAALQQQAEKHRQSIVFSGSILEETIPGPDGPVNVRLYRPLFSDTRVHPVLIYLHGGGWIAGSIAAHDPACRFLATDSKCIVLSVAYRLAPEHRFPAALEDVYAVLSWCDRYADTIGGDTKRIGVGGSSAGGNLAAAVCLLAKKRDGPLPRFQLLVFPALNLASFDTDSYRRFSEPPGLLKSQMILFRSCYLTRPADRFNPLVSPLLADDLNGMPPALIITGERDVLRDEGRAYAVRLEDAGVPVRYLQLKGLGHASIMWGAAAHEMLSGLREASDMLRHYLQAECADTLTNQAAGARERIRGPARIPESPAEAGRFCRQVRFQ